MRSQYTPSYYRKSPVPSIELPIDRFLRYSQLFRLVCHSFCAPRSAASHIYLPLISHNHRVRSRTAHNGRGDMEHRVWKIGVKMPESNCSTHRPPSSIHSGFCCHSIYHPSPPRCSSAFAFVYIPFSYIVFSTPWGG